MKVLYLFMWLLLTTWVSATVTKADVATIVKLVLNLKRKRNQLKKVVSAITAEKEKYFKDLNNIETSLQNLLEERKTGLVNAQTKEGNIAFKALTNNFAKSQNKLSSYVNDQMVASSKNFSTLYNTVVGEDKSLKGKIKLAVTTITKDLRKRQEAIEKELNGFAAEVKKVERQKKPLTDIPQELFLLSRQVQLQQFNEFEKARSDGRSGIKQKQTFQSGSKSFYSNDYNGESIAGISDLETSRNSLGIGKFVAVLNGIEFRVDASVYELAKPISNSKVFHKTEPITSSDVPVEVLKLKDPQQQIEEMREWFKAFKNQNKNVRPYQKYFKPVLTYLEGAWLDEEADDVTNNMVQYLSHTGSSAAYQSIDYLPSKIMSFEEKTPRYSRWSYRLLSHPLSVDIPTHYLQFRKDVVSEERLGLPQDKLIHSLAARFDIEGVRYDGKREKGRMFYTFLDSLMEEIPGKDNYGATINANEFDSVIKSANPKNENKPLNGAYYHRAYKLDSKDAMGVDAAQRTFCDRVYVAMNTQTKVAGPVYQTHSKVFHSKVSYAVPFELIYMTPLQKWNPFQIHIVGDCELVTGKGTKADPYSAACPDRFFLTPNSFFTGSSDPFDCTKPRDGSNLYYFKAGQLRHPVCVRASGVRAILPQIHGIEGFIRQRYPIMPVYGEGSSVWKRLNAFEDSIDDTFDKEVNQIRYYTGESTHSHIPTHKHVLLITKGERNALIDGQISYLQKVTEVDDRHQHIFTLKVKESEGKRQIYLSSCDSGQTEATVCFDHHVNAVIEFE